MVHQMCLFPARGAHQSRALRRHHRERMIQRAMRSLALSYEEDWEKRRQYAVGWYNHLARCSCWMCGNPRKYERRVTVQEKRQLLAALAEWEAA
jgi:hypothetical protein